MYYIAEIKEIALAKLQNNVPCGDCLKQFNELEKILSIILPVGKVFYMTVPKHNLTVILISATVSPV